MIDRREFLTRALATVAALLLVGRFAPESKSWTEPAWVKPFGHQHEWRHCAITWTDGREDEALVFVDGELIEGARHITFPSDSPAKHVALWDLRLPPAQIAKLGTR